MDIIELSKENVQPLKRGRNAAALAAAVDQGRESKSQAKLEDHRR
jgi:hypothetical protein